MQLKRSVQRRRPLEPHGHRLMNVAGYQAADVATVRRFGRTAEAGCNLDHGRVSGGHELLARLGLTVLVHLDGLDRTYADEFEDRGFRLPGARAIPMYGVLHVD
jgi:hypothetical protein